MENLPVEEHRQNAHRQVNEEGGESDNDNLLRKKDGHERHFEPQGIPAMEEVRDHDEDGDGLTD